MTLVEEAELYGLRRRQIKDYNPALNSFTKIQDQIFKFFDDKELTDDGKCKILAQLQERFSFLLKKFKKSALPPATVRPPHPAALLAAPDDHVGDGPPPAVVEADREGYIFTVKSFPKRNAMLPMKISHLQRPKRSDYLF